MGDHGYIYVKNWDKFQHYKDQSSPAWIKTYRSLLNDDAYLALSLADRGLLLNLWLLVSDAGDGRVSADRRLLGRRLNVRRVSLEPLIQAGFIAVRSRKSLGKPYRKSRPEAEAEAEREYKKQGAPDVAGMLGEPGVLDEDRRTALHALIGAVGGDKGTAHQITTRVMQRRSSQFEIERAHAAAMAPGVQNRAGCAMKVLADMANERAA